MNADQATHSAHAAENLSKFKGLSVGKLPENCRGMASYEDARDTDMNSDNWSQYVSAFMAV